ncbi:MAG: DUF3616 domain-containing protein [Thiotrichaceae bacterium]|nr:DUF3616 domain-containing protein [Thiotrichaceae bacterium]
MLNEFINIYEPSGIAQLSNGQIIIVEDDGLTPVSLLKFNDTNPLEHLEKVNKFNFLPIDVNDLEAVTIDQHDHLYAITSHSLNRKGKLKNERNRLVHFTINDQAVDEVSLIENLREWIIASYPELKKSTKIKNVQKDGGLNIEGLAYDKKKQQLLIGLRSPLNKQDQAIIIPITLTKQTFKNKLFNDKPRELITLDLNGAGIRDFTYVPYLNAFLILSGTSSADKKSAQLWIWKRGKQAVKIKIKGAKKFGTAEGITPVKLLNKDAGIMIVIDDGEQKSAQPGHYLFISYDQLKFKYDI